LGVAGEGGQWAASMASLGGFCKDSFVRVH
jgi:hypothetical protein